MKYITPVKQMLASYCLFLLFIFIFTILSGCDSGWSVFGWEVE